MLLIVFITRAFVVRADQTSKSDEQMSRYRTSRWADIGRTSEQIRRWEFWRVRSVPTLRRRENIHLPFDKFTLYISSMFLHIIAHWNGFSSHNVAKPSSVTYLFLLLSLSCIRTCIRGLQRFLTKWGEKNWAGKIGRFICVRFGENWFFSPIFAFLGFRVQSRLFCRYLGCLGLIFLIFLIFHCDGEEDKKELRKIDILC